MASCRKDWRKVVPETRANELQKNPHSSYSKLWNNDTAFAAAKNRSLKTEFKLVQDSNPWPLGSWAVQHSTNWANQPTGSPGGGGIPRISSDRDDRTGTKIETKKIPRASNKPPKIPGSKFNPRKIPCMPNFRAIKISRTQRQSQNSLVFILITEVSRGNYHESSDCFEYPRKSVVKSSYPKKFLTKFSYPKKSQNQNFQTPKSPWIIPVTWNPDYPCWAAGSLWVGSL